MFKNIKRDLLKKIKASFDKLFDNSYQSKVSEDKKEKIKILVFIIILFIVFYICNNIVNVGFSKIKCCINIKVTAALVVFIFNWLIRYIKLPETISVKKNTKKIYCLTLIITGILCIHLFILLLLIDYFFRFIGIDLKKIDIQTLILMTMIFIIALSIPISLRSSIIFFGNSVALKFNLESEFLSYVIFLTIYFLVYKVSVYLMLKIFKIEKDCQYYYVKFFKIFVIALLMYFYLYINTLPPLVDDANNVSSLNNAIAFITLLIMLVNVRNDEDCINLKQ